MPGFSNVRDLVDKAYTQGNYQYTLWRKTNTTSGSVGFMFDWSTGGGNPSANYYASEPLVAAILNGQKGLFHGGNVSPKKKYLANLTALNTAIVAVPNWIILCDYLLYYPFIDLTISDEQFFDNTVTLPRYTDGMGVQIILVNVGVGALTTGTVSLKYTNQNGTSGRQTPTVSAVAPNFIGYLATDYLPSTRTTWMRLAAGDTGVRSIESITSNGLGDGLITAVLVKPLANIFIAGITGAAEVNFLRTSPRLPQILDGAYLNFLGTAVTNQAIGEATFIWG